MEGASVIIFITVQKIYYPLLCIMGIPANLFTFYMISFRNCGMSEAAIVFLSCLAIMDTCYLVWVILIDLTLVFWQEQPFWHSYPWCEILGFLQYGSLYSSSWVVVGFTIERFLVLRSTSGSHMHFHRTRFTKLTCGAIVFASHLASVPMGWINAAAPVNLTGDGVVVTECRYQKHTYTTVLVWITTFLSGGIPIVLVILFNYLIGVHLSRASQLFTKEERRFMRGRSTRGMVRRTILLLGTVSAAFVVLSLPRFVTYVILRTQHNDEAFDRDDYSVPINVASDVANMLQNLNSTTNFLLYCMVSRRFRQELGRVFACKPRVRERGSFFSMRVFAVTDHKVPSSTEQPGVVVLTDVKHAQG